MSELVVPVLEAASSTGPECGSLRSAAEYALWIANAVNTHKSGKPEWIMFASHIQQGVACVIAVATKDGGAMAHAFQLHLKTLEAAVESISRDMRAMFDYKSSLPRVKILGRERRRIRLYTSTFDSALALFNLGSTLSSHKDFNKLIECSSSTLSTIKAVPNEVVTVGHKIAKSIAYRSNLELLPYAAGVSWDPRRTCLPGTRTTLLDDIMHFISDTRPSAPRTFLLMDVVGSGKTTVANSVARLCAQADPPMLLSSYLFNGAIEGRDDPELLFSTLAHDLSKVHPAVADAISTAIEQHRSLLSPPLARQFEHLILRPATLIPEPLASRPIVVVIDAVDAAVEKDEDLLRILVEDLPRLPPNFRFLLTSRTSRSIFTAFSRAKSNVTIRPVSPTLQNLENLADVSLFARHALRIIAETRSLGPDWPGERLTDALVTSSEGLIGWVAGVCEYLLKRSVDPRRQLEKLVAATPSPAPGVKGKAKSKADLPALSKMNALYAATLARAPWDDDDFVDAYRSVLGALLVLRAPLKAKVLDGLLRSSEEADELPPTQAREALAPLAPLLTGILDSESEAAVAALQVLHPSFKDFVAHRCSGVHDETAKYAIDEQEAEEHVAMCALAVLNARLGVSATGTEETEVETEAEGVDPDQTLRDEDHALILAAVSSSPLVPTNTNTNTNAAASDESVDAEVLAYSVKHWMTHVCAVSNPSEALLERLGVFLQKNLANWMKFCVQEGEFKGLKELREWAKAVEFDLWSFVDRAQLASFLQSLSTDLHMTRSRHNSTLSRARVDSLSASSSLKHAHSMSMSLSSSSAGSTASTSKKASLAVVVLREAIALKRDLAHLRPAVFNTELAASLHTLSAYLTDDAASSSDDSTLGPLELDVASDADVYRLPLHSHSPSGSPHSQHLRVRGDSHLDPETQKEALDAIHEAVTLRRKLATAYPALYTPILAGSLHEFARRLDEMDLTQDAEMARQEESMLLPAVSKMVSGVASVPGFGRTATSPF